MRILLLISIFISLSLEADSLKSGVDISKILQQLDQVSEKIKQKKMQAAKADEILGHSNTPEDNKINMRMKKEQELQQKEQDLLLMQKQEAYLSNLEKIKRNKKSFLLKRSNQIEAILKKRLYELKIKREYPIPVKEYMKIGDKAYAYLTQDKLDSAKRYIYDIENDIQGIKKAIHSLKSAKLNSKEKWMMVLSNLENQYNDMPAQVKSAAMKGMPSNPGLPPMPGMGNKKKNYIKVAKGDSFENIKIKYISENKVVIVPVLDY